MKAMNVTIENGKEVSVKVGYASKSFEGRGRYALNVHLCDNFGNAKIFKQSTTDMPFIDSLDDMSTEEKYEAIYNHVEYKIEEQVIEWVRENH